MIRAGGAARRRRTGIGGVPGCQRELHGGVRRHGTAISPTSGTWKPVIASLTGLLITGLLVGYLWLLTGRTARVEQVVAQRWRDLRESQHYIRRLIDNTGDAFFLHDEQGKILDVNKHACDVLGYCREELLSMTIADVEGPACRRRGSPQDSWPPPAEVSGVFLKGFTVAKTARQFPSKSIGRGSRSGGKAANAHRGGRSITDRTRAEKVLGRTAAGSAGKLRETHVGFARQLTAALHKFQALGRLAEQSDGQTDQQTFDEGVRLLREVIGAAQ